MLTRRSALADLIEDALLSQDVYKQDLADAIGVVPASISKWLRHDRPDAIPPHHWGAICSFLKIPWKTWLKVAQEDVPEDVDRYRKLVRSLSGR